MFRVTAKITAHKGKEEALKTCLMDLVANCANHKGMSAYRLHQNTKDPTQFLFYEQFNDESCFTLHNQSEELAANQDKRMALTASAELDFWQPLAESGSITRNVETLHAIHTRRSIRSFTETPLNSNHVQQILEAAMTAPSASNSQPWEFIMIRNKESHKQIMQMHPHANMIEHAPLAILVCGNLQKEKYPGFWVQDCAAAIQNMLLAARALGIGTTWCGIHPVEKLIEGFKDTFALPEHIAPLGFVVLGMPAQDFTKRDTFNKQRIHEESFKK